MTELAPVPTLSRENEKRAAVGSNPAEKGGKLDSIQIFRGWAALLVVLSHASTFSVGTFGENFLGGAFQFGNAGVDFFFVLSGFIIYYIHRQDLGQGGRLRPFAVKRFVRIYPIYWVACALIIPLYFLNKNPLARDPVAVLTSLLLVPQDHWPVLSVAWTLTHEMLFYTIFGLLIWKARFTVWPVAAWVLGCVVTYLALLASPHDARAVDLLLPFPWRWLFHPHNIEFLMGCFAAYVLQRYRPQKLQPLLLAGTLLFVICAALDQPSKPWKAVATFGQPLSYGLASMLLVIGAGAWDLAGKKLALPGFRLWHFLGDASYSIYLFHGIALSFAYRLAKKAVELHVPAIIASLAAIVAATAFGCVAHVLAEKPLLRILRKRLLSPRTAHA